MDNDEERRYCPNKYKKALLKYDLKDIVL